MSVRPGLKAWAGRQVRSLATDDRTGVLPAPVPLRSVLLGRGDVDVDFLGNVHVDVPALAGEGAGARPEREVPNPGKECHDEHDPEDGAEAAAAILDDHVVAVIAAVRMVRH